jgi:hypothetical protein
MSAQVGIRAFVKAGRETRLGWEFAQHDARAAGTDKDRRLLMLSGLLFRLLSPLVLVCLVLTSCGDLPEPFLGNPGATARRLAQPMTPLLTIPPGSDTLLPDDANQYLATQIAAALQATEVPALVRQPQKNDWRVLTTARRTGDSVTPLFSVRNAEDKEQGIAEGEPVPLKDWATASPALMRQVAAEAGPRIGAVLTSIRIARDKADPDSLYNRPARVLVTDVTGAPGDGNAALTRQMRAHLATLGSVVLTTPAGADFVVAGDVKVVPIEKRQERVEIQWTVQKAGGSERGKVVQLNALPAGTLDHSWGDIAVVVATEAAAGINDVLKRQSGHQPAGGDSAGHDAAAKPPPGS